MAEKKDEVVKLQTLTTATLHNLFKSESFYKKVE